MHSTVAKAAEQALVEETQRLTPEERLNALLTHCELVTDLYEAGLQLLAGQNQVRA